MAGGQEALRDDAQARQEQLVGDVPQGETGRERRQR
jgi:hypothetical protein